MSSLLLASSDPASVSRIEELAVGAGIRVRSVGSLQRAREWLSMHPFSVVLVDGRFESRDSLHLLAVAWKHNPWTLCGLFNLHGEVDGKWDAKLLGAHVYEKDSALPGIQLLLTQLPELNFDPQEFPILLVEDLDSPRDIICSYIESLGYAKTDGVGSADQALEMLQENPNAYSCIVTDINMPQMSGIEFIKEIRRQEHLNHLPVIVLTAYATIENLVGCVRAGATGFLVKPPKKKALRQELEKAKRIFLSGQNPRLCDPDEAHFLEDALYKQTA